MPTLSQRLRASPTSDIMIEAADRIDAQAAEIARLKTALRGMLQLDEENHQRLSGDNDVCKEVRNARAALSGEGK